MIIKTLYFFLLFSQVDFRTLSKAKGIDVLQLKLLVFDN